MVARTLEESRLANRGASIPGAIDGGHRAGLGGRDQINVGITTFASPQVRRNTEAEKALRVKPARTFEYADHVANGVACAIAPQAPSTCARSGSLTVLAALLFSTFRMARETAAQRPRSFQRAIESLPIRPAITMIHAGEWRAITPMWRTYPAGADWRRSESGLPSGTPI